MRTLDPSLASEENAMTIYTDVVADDEDGELTENIKEVAALYAAAKYSRIPGEDKELIPFEEVLEDLTSEGEMMLAVDGSLI
ncbi:hypothetical protein BK049_05160 [Bacillus xiamenensis]|uniref:Uncharacterized protein n=1 Tax=Bacillus xiamenensis TaxID=1178537 RepID=A0AAC9NDG5_9BACI|nr:hypothetical protein BK049_05160 [Bacillus xiamenensis]